MEYRAGFVAQAAGMVLNNILYFAFWILYFNRFHQVRGWRLGDVFLVYGVVATAFGLSVYLMGNVLRLSTLISEGGLDYYLSMPRPVLLHALASRSVASGAGDVTFGLLTYLVWSGFGVAGMPVLLLAGFLGAVVLVSTLTWFQSLAFWIGDSSRLSSQMLNAMVTFSVYPITIFDGPARFLLYTLLPAAFVGAVPAQLVHRLTVASVAQLAIAAAVSAAVATATFQRGLRRYQSGSAINVQV